MSDTEWPGYWAMQRSVGARRGTRDVISASGEDTATFLQGQLSQDVVALPVGESTYSLLLKPQGKVDAWLRVTRRGDNDYVIDVDAGFGEAVVTRLKRFLLRTKCTIELLDWESVSLRGPDAAEVVGSQAEITAAAVGWTVPAIDLLGPAVMIPSSVVEVEAAEFDALRIESGVPAMGAELTENTIPEAAGVVEGSVSFTKGCYTGQELVARVDSRGGNVPHRLRRIVFAAAAIAPPELGSDLLVDEASVGTLTSVGWSPSAGALVGLAYVARKVEVPGSATLGHDGALLSVSVEEV